jgi:hypothetical protein
MPEKFQPGFMYIKSEELKQEVAFSLKSGWVYCEDKGPDGKLVNYSPEEIKILKAGGDGKITLSVHNVKKIFGGRLVQYDGKGTDDKGKSDESGYVQNIINNTNPGTKIPEITGNSPAVRPGELDIY